METSTTYEVATENKEDNLVMLESMKEPELELEVESEKEHEYELELELEVESDSDNEIEMESPRESTEEQFCPILYFGYIMLGFFILAVLIL